MLSKRYESTEVDRRTLNLTCFATKIILTCKNCSWFPPVADLGAHALLLGPYSSTFLVLLLDETPLWMKQQ